MVMVAESIHFDHLIRNRREPLTFCKKRKHGGTSVVHVNIVAWAGRLLYFMSRSSEV